MEGIILSTVLAATLAIGVVVLASHAIHPSVGADTRSAPVTESQKSTYVCPMHPEVQSDKPGDCPKCGMTLVGQSPGQPSNPGKTMPFRCH